jgi:hypothetical protein
MTGRSMLSLHLVLGSHWLASNEHESFCQSLQLLTILSCRHHGFRPDPELVLCRKPTRRHPSKTPENRRVIHAVVRMP